jgi:hypothetical protein
MRATLQETEDSTPIRLKVCSREGSIAKETWTAGKRLPEVSPKEDDMGVVIKLKSNVTHYSSRGYNFKHRIKVNIVFKQTS